MKNGDTKDTIKDIVRRGQLLLCDLERTAIWHKDEPYWLRLKSRGKYPQSLGELCIEIAQSKITTPHIEYSRTGNWETTVTYYNQPFNRWIRGDIQQLKQAMWHKNDSLQYEIAVVQAQLSLMTPEQRKELALQACGSWKD